ncbi:MAG: alcohol dehydrogenase catalytic domain-containing protein [Treponema sp.]|nr:alcohol dehydrogenase catalytic domain-containing protein [Treponema sp.]
MVKMKAAAICGSDVHIYHGASPVATYPHERVMELLEWPPGLRMRQMW